MKTACRERSCPAIVEDAYCSRHKSPKDGRPSASRRGYDYKWRRIRNAYLDANPRCEDPFDRHAGMPPRATEVDHIIPIRDGGARLDPRNMRSLCRGCHRKRHADE